MLHAGKYGVGAGLRSRVLPDERGRQQAALLIVDPGQRLFQFCDHRLDALNGYFVRYLTCDCLVSLDPLFEARPVVFFVDTWQLLARTLRRVSGPTGPPRHAGRALLRWDQIPLRPPPTATLLPGVLYARYGPHLVLF